MATAGIFVVGMSANAFINYKGVRISPAHKHAVIQDWGNERTTRVTEVITAHPIGFHAHGFVDIRHEGLGVDHEQWLKQKEQEHQQA